MDLLIALQENGTLKIQSPWSQMLWRHMARGIRHIQHIPWTAGLGLYTIARMVCQLNLKKCWGVVLSYNHTSCGVIITNGIIQMYKSLSFDSLCHGIKLVASPVLVVLTSFKSQYHMTTGMEILFLKLSREFCCWKIADVVAHKVQYANRTFLLVKRDSETEILCT